MNSGSKAKAIFIAACVFAAFLTYFGIKLFSTRQAEFSDGEHFFLGVIFALAGIIIVSMADNVRNRFLIGYILLGIGIYMFGRASGVIKDPWLAYVAGAACLASAAVVLYVARPKPVRTDNRPVADKRDEPGV